MSYQIQKKDLPLSLTKKEANELAKLLNDLPSPVRVGPWDIKIEAREGYPEGLESHIPWGLYSPDRNLILICRCDEIPNKYWLAGTVIHELLHAMWHVAHLDDKSVKEELAVTMLERGMVSLFRDNPKLLKWWSKAVA